LKRQGASPPVAIHVPGAAHVHATLSERFTPVRLPAANKMNAPCHGRTRRCRDGNMTRGIAVTEAFHCPVALSCDLRTYELNRSQPGRGQLTELWLNSNTPNRGLNHLEFRVSWPILMIPQLSWGDLIVRLTRSKRRSNQP
jgi:hypothetical protein